MLFIFKIHKSAFVTVKTGKFLNKKWFSFVIIFHLYVIFENFGFVFSHLNASIFWVSWEKFFNINQKKKKLVSNSGDKQHQVAKHARLFHNVVLSNKNKLKRRTGSVLNNIPCTEMKKIKSSLYCSHYFK